jgi:competence protein ComEA
MRTRSSFDDHVKDVTRRRLAALTAELAAARGEAPESLALGEIAGGERAGTESSGGQRTAGEGTAGKGAAGEGAAGESAAGGAGTDVPGRHALRAIPLRLRLIAAVNDHAPAGLRGGQHLGSAGMGLVALVVAVGLALSAWWLVGAGGLGREPGDVVPPRVAAPPAQSNAVQAPRAGSGSGPPAVPGADSTPSTTGAAGRETGTGDQIVVDVVGKVRRPGIAVLPAGSRVVDAVRAAGGVRPGVDPATVNMARLLTDGEQVVVGGPPTPAGALVPAVPAAPGGATALVNLNTADQAALESLPGVGPVTAAAILQWRTEHGGFTSVDELLEVSGIGEATMAEIAPHVTL